MGFIKNFINRKVKEEINKTTGLDSFEKTVLKKGYENENITISELKNAGKNRKAREELEDKCRRLVINTYIYSGNSHYVPKGNDGVPVIKKTNYKPINAGVYWTNVATKGGFILQQHNGNGRYRILDDEGFWYGSGNEKMKEKFEKL